MHILRRPLAEIPDPLALPPPRSRGASPFDAAIRPPGSKSLSNRALLLAALAPGQSILHGALVDADDAVRMIDALRTLGATIDVHEDRVVVHGVGGRWKPVHPNGSPATGDLLLNLNNAGTATRFLAAAALLSPVPIVIDGNARMRERPIGELGDILKKLGASISYSARPGFPPMRIVPPAFPPDATVLEIPTTQSSQFISALLLIAPWLPHHLTIKLVGEITSESYINMTLGLLQRLGASVQTAGDNRVIRVGPAAASPTNRDLIPGDGIPPFEYDVEPDASGATYFWAAAALVPDSTCRLLDLDAGSLQGDTGFVELLGRMGATSTLKPALAGSRASLQVRGPRTLLPIMADMSDMPDAAMTLAVVASFASGVSVLRGLRTLRVKESDRIAAMQTELAKIGVKIDSPVAGDSGAMTITPPGGGGGGRGPGIDCSPSAPPVHFDTYDDHRIAMSLALIALRRPNVFINHPQCVAKTYAAYWRDLAGLF